MSGFLGDIASGVISSTIGPLFTRLIDLIPDPAERAREAAKIQQSLLAADATMIAAQNAINLAEAQNENIFVSGWRPAVGWVCVAGLAWAAFARPVLEFGAAFFVDGKLEFPNIDTGLITTMLIPLLGLGGLKTAERIYGVSNEGQKPTRTIVLQPSQALLNLPSAPPRD